MKNVKKNNIKMKNIYEEPTTKIKNFNCNNNLNNNYRNINKNIDNVDPYVNSEKHIKTQSRMDMQSLVDMCTKKLDIDPIHKKALLLRASSYIKNKDLDKVNIIRTN